MEELRQEFLAEAISKLEDLREKLSGAEEISDATGRDVFRLLHTLKGTSQTFGLAAAGGLAHELENLLQAKRENGLAAQSDFPALLKEGARQLLAIFQNVRDDRGEIGFPGIFVEKIRASISTHSISGSPARILEGIVPPELLRQLSAQEKEALAAAINEGKNFHLLEAGFDFVNFAEKYKSLREILSRNGEIAANFPSPKFALENKIGFQIFFVSGRDDHFISGIVEPFGAKLLSRNDGVKFSHDLTGVLAQAVAAGEKTARALGKTVEFETEISLGDEKKVSGERLKTISAALLHLVRNAVDHAIESRGKVKIGVTENPENGELLVRVADDGRGIDVGKIRSKALAKNLIPADENPPPGRAELLNLIFAHGFSTSETVSDISGRGVGLDVVKSAIEQAGGSVGVESTAGKGTTFEIRLPEEIETRRRGDAER